MSGRIKGLHHITLCTGSAQGDVDFFVKVMGQRFVKRTLFYDGREPIYHLYFADELGSPGSVMTTFPMRRTGIKGRRGGGQFTACSYSVPKGSLGFWRDHLRRHEIEVAGSRSASASVTSRSRTRTVASASRSSRSSTTTASPGIRPTCRRPTQFAASTAGPPRSASWAIWMRS